MKARYYLLTALYCAGIFYLSSQSKPIPVDMSFPPIDKLGHLAVFGGLCALVSLGIHRSGQSKALAVQLVVPIVFTVLYGVTDEVHQLFVPDRSFDLLDLVADAGGALLAQAALFLYWRTRARRGQDSTSTV